MISFWVKLLLSLLNLIPLGLLFCFYKLIMTFEFFYFVATIILILFFAGLHKVVIPYIFGKLEDLTIKVKNLTEITYKRTLLLSLSYLSLLFASDTFIVIILYLLLIIITLFFKLYFCDPLTVVFQGWRTYVVEIHRGTHFFLFTTRNLLKNNTSNLALTIFQLESNLIVDKNAKIEKKEVI